MNNLKRIVTASLLVLFVGHIAAKEVPPVGGKPKPFAVPNTETVMLENGLKVTFVPYGKTPKATLRLVTFTGNVDDGELIWLSDTAFKMLRQGTSSMTAKELAQNVANMGGEIRTSVGTNSSFIGMNVLTEYTDDALKLLSDMVLNSTYSQQDLDRITAENLRNLSLSQSNPGSLANAAFNQQVFGNHPYGRVFPTQESLKKISVQSTKDFISTYFTPNRSHLYVSGVFDKASVLSAVKDSFSNWESGDTRKSDPVITQTGPTLTFIEREGAVQSTLRLGLATVSPSHPDYQAMELMNAMLGGSFSSRITANIRENKGYTYSPRSSLQQRVGAGVWFQAADVTASVTGPAIYEIIKEINLLSSTAPPKEELEGMQNYLAGLFVLRNSSQGAIIDQLAFSELYGLGDDYLKNYVDNIYSVTPDDIKNVAKTFLDVSKMHLTIVGDTSVVKPQLEAVEALKPFL